MLSLELLVSSWDFNRRKVATEPDKFVLKNLNSFELRWVSEAPLY